MGEELSGDKERQVGVVPAFRYQPPTEPWLEIVYRDDDLVAFSKPSGLLSVPGRALAHKDSLLRRARVSLPTLKEAHRLDMDTSGLIVMALNPAAHRHISGQFAARRVSKSYIALVAGEMEREAGLVDLPLICDWPNRPRQMVDHERGKPAQTGWRVLAGACPSGCTRLELTPVTGRSHQLRVHMLALGHPILGDRLYGDDASRRAAPRLMLHAERLGLAHPVSGQPLSLRVSAPF